MLTTEQVKKIAEYLGIEFKFVDRTGVRVRRYGFDLLNNKFDYTGLFNPEKDDADAMMVFKALRDECNNSNYRIVILNGISIDFENNHGVVEDLFFADEFNNENVCLAYLAVMGE